MVDFGWVFNYGGYNLFRSKCIATNGTKMLGVQNLRNYI